MIAQPPIVKIVVPIPPVDGRALSLLSVMEVLAVRTAVALSPATANVALD